MPEYGIARILNPVKTGPEIAHTGLWNIHSAMLATLYSGYPRPTMRGYGSRAPGIYQCQYRTAALVAVPATWQRAAQTHPACRTTDQTTGKNHSQDERQPNSEIRIVALSGGPEASGLTRFLTVFTQ